MRASFRVVPQRFTDVVRAERVRVTTLRRPKALAVVALIVAVGFAALTAAIAQAVSVLGGVYSDEGAVLLSRAAVSGATTLALMVGAIAIDVTGTERATGARHLTNLGTPRRGRTYLARLCVMACGGGLVGLSALAVCTLTVVAISAASGVEDPLVSAGLSFSRVVGTLLTMALVVGFAHGVVWIVPHTLSALGVVVSVVWLAPIVVRVMGGAEQSNVLHVVLRALPTEHLGELAAGDGTGVSVAVAGAWTLVALLGGALRRRA